MKKENGREEKEEGTREGSRSRLYQSRAQWWIYLSFFQFVPINSVKERMLFDFLCVIHTTAEALLRVSLKKLQHAHTHLSVQGRVKRKEERETREEKQGERANYVLAFRSSDFASGEK